MANKTASETVLITLEVTPAAAEAIETLQEALQTDARLYRVIEAHFRRLQGRLEGPLTEFLAAAVGRV